MRINMKKQWMIAHVLLATLALDMACAQDVVIRGENFKLPSDAELAGSGTNEHYIVPAAAKEGVVARAQAVDLPPGRYAVDFRLATPPFGRKGDAIVACQVQAPGQPAQTRSLRSQDMPQDASPLRVRLIAVLTKPSTLAFTVSWAGNQDVLAALPNINDAADGKDSATLVSQDLPAVHLYDITLHRLDAGLGVMKVFPNKLLYRRGETGTVAVTVRNFSQQSMSGKLALTLVRDLSTARPAGELDVTVEAGQELLVSMPFTCGREQYGHEARVELRQGEKRLDVNGDVFNVSDSVWPVGMGGPTVMTGHSGLTDSAGIPAGVLQLRADYVNWWEKIFWPPDDWGDMTPSSDEWISGQSARWEKAVNIKAMVAACKPHGIKSITYGKHVAMNNEGWDLVRRHPEWFYMDDKGHPRGSFHTYDLYRWNDFKFHMVDGKFSHSTFMNTGGWCVSPDFRKTEPLEHGIRELIESSRQFGWDGVRFDGHWTAGNDELSASNMRRLKEALWQYDTNFLFGFNYSWSYGHQTSHLNQLGMVSFNHEFRESMAGGGMFMQEAIGQRYGFSESGSYISWRDYAVKEAAAANGLRETGGSYHFIYGEASYYKFILGTAAGAHPAYGLLQSIPGCENWGRFLTRWSGLVWDLNLKPLPAEGQVEVKADGPIWWPEWLKERLADEKTRQVIVHLINPPVDDRIEGLGRPMPAPLRNVRVRLKVPAGQTLKQAMLLDPMSDTPAPLSFKLEGDWASLTVPVVQGWKMVVAEFNGSFKLPQPRPMFTEPPDPVKVAEGRGSASGPAARDPMRPDLPGQKPNQLVFETDGGYNSVSAKGIDDPGAINGRAQVRDTGVKSAGIGRTWIGPVSPGKWRARLRIKLEDTATTPRSQSVTVRVFCNHKSFDFNYRFATADAGLPKEQTLIADNAYHYYEIPFEQKTTIAGWPCFIGTASTPDEGDHRLLLDHIILEQDEAYTDSRMLAANPKPVPAGLTVGGEPGLDVMVVKGWTWESYGLDKVLPPTGGTIRVTELWSGTGDADKFPQTHEELFKQDIVVLVNVGAMGMSYDGRKVLKDFVESGGGLVILGGLYTLGQGDIKDTILEPIMPVELTNRDVFRLEKPLALTPTGGTDGDKLARVISSDLWSRSPLLYWRHAVKAKTGANVSVLTGGEPVLISWKVGKGTVVVFAGTPLGKGRKDELPFWQWDGWPILLKGMIDTAGAK
jgi:uncharacterized membrane protein